MTDREPGAFSLNVVVWANECRVILRGELDMDTVPDLEIALEELVEKDHSQITLDFSQIAFADSTGVESLIWTHKRLEKQGRRLIIVSPRPMVMRVFEITGLMDILHIEMN